MTTMNKRGAKAAGYRALTGRYQLPEERGMLDGVLADMRSGSIDHVLVKANGGVAVWRRGTALTGGNPKSETRDPKQNGRRVSAGRRWK
jgi:hypothetical protein